MWSPGTCGREKRIHSDIPPSHLTPWEIRSRISRYACSEQERRAKAEEARAEAEWVLSQQAAELERKKAEMVAREAEREQARQAQVV